MKSIKADYDIEWRFYGEMYGPASKEIDYVTAFNGKSPPGTSCMSMTSVKNNDFGLPLHLRSRISWWSRYLEKEKILYLQWNSVHNRKNQTFADFYTKLFNEADELDIEKFVIDIRYNSGGNGVLATKFLNEVIKRDYLSKDGNLFVITGKKSFSASISHILAPLFEYLNPIVVGEPSSARINQFGDPIDYHLPHSNFELTVSSRYYQGSFWGDTTNTITVNVPIFLYIGRLFLGKRSGNGLHPSDR